MKAYTVHFRRKGDPYGLPIRQETTQANNASEALRQVTYHRDRETWHSIACGGKRVITIAEYRRRINDPSMKLENY